MVKNWYKLSDKRLRVVIFNKYDGKCAYCGCNLEERFCIDHIRPLNRNKRWDSSQQRSKDNEGKHTIENLNPSCPPCNISKSSFPLETWRKELELKISRIERDSSTFRLLKKFDLVGIKKYNVTFYFETLKNNSL